MYLNLNKIAKYFDDELLFETENLLVDRSIRIALIGDNGIGKTTLFNIIAGRDLKYQGVLRKELPVSFLRQINDAGKLSGGQKQMELLSQAFLKDHHLLLLDEPTSQLDENGIEKILSLAKRYTGPIIAISHDRFFLNHFAQEIWYFDQGVIRSFAGDFKTFNKFQTDKLLYQQRVFERSRKKSKKLQQKVQKNRQHAQKISKGATRSPFYAKKASKLFKLVKNIERRADQLEQVKHPFVKKNLKLVDNKKFSKRKSLLKINDLDVFAADKKLVSSFSLNISAGDKVFLVGDNGAGKTTTLKTILASKSPQVTFSQDLKIAFFKQDLLQLDPRQNVLKNVESTTLQTEQTVRDFLGAFGLRRDIVFKQIKQLSAGQKVRAALVKVLLSDADLLVLDEPNNFLDITAIYALEDFLKSYQGGLLVVSHDHELVKNAATKIIKIQGQSIIEL